MSGEPPPDWDAYYARVRQLQKAETALMDETTLQAIVLVLLQKMRGRLKKSDLNAIEFARTRVADGDSLPTQLAKILRETAAELDVKRNRP